MRLHIHKQLLSACTIQHDVAMCSQVFNRNQPAEQLQPPSQSPARGHVAFNSLQLVPMFSLLQKGQNLGYVRTGLKLHTDIPC